jgi:predicted RNase H-like HicB family nuclease
MNLPISPNLNDFNLHILLKALGKEQFVASVAELSDIQVTATTREDAIEQLQKIIREHLEGIEVLTFPVILGKVATERENPWTEFIGMYEGDEDFARIAAQLQAERELE